MKGLTVQFSKILAGDAKNEVPITNLAKIQFPGSKKNGKEGTLRVERKYIGENIIFTLRVK